MKPVVMLLIGFLCLAHLHTRAAHPSRTDSLGVATVEGKTFVRHRVETGESLSVIARRYGVSVTEVQKANKLDGTSIKAGQVLLVPMLQAPKSGGGSTASGSKPSAMQRIVHTVNKGETLFGIARKYGTSVEQIRSLNRMEDDALAVGQQLVINEDGKSATSGEGSSAKPGNPPASKPAAQAGNPPASADTHPAADSRPRTQSGISNTSSEHQTGSLIDMMADMSKPEQDSMLKQNVFPEVEVLTSEKAVVLPGNARKKPYTDPYSGKKYLQVEEVGSVGFISDYSTDQTKFYAFHKTLPVGSYLRIDYPSKNQSILVEVISNLDPKSSHVALISAKCGHYLSLWKEGEQVKLRYVVPDVQ